MDREEQRTDRTGATLRNSRKHEKTGADRLKQKSESGYETGSGSKKGGGQEKPQLTWQQKLLLRKRLRRRRFFLCFGCLLAVAYIAVAVYFRLHFYEDTQIYGIDCSQLKAEEAKTLVAEKLGDYQLEIQERDGRTETISAGQIRLAFVDDNSVDGLLKAQRSYLWPIMILLDRSNAVKIAFSYDQDSAREALEALECMDDKNAVQPQDAYMTATDTGFEVVSEVMGTLLDHEKTENAVLNALDHGEASVSLEETDCYINPEIYGDDEQLNSDAAAMSELADAYITYDFGDREEVVNAELIRDWIVKAADGSFVIDDLAVTDYVQSLAEKYDTFGLSREFVTTGGTTVTLTEGDYGWAMDQSATLAALLNALESGYRGTMEPEYIYTAMSRDTDDIGGTYVEICISKQEMWCYQDYVCIVDTPVVTGNPNKGNATPSGGVWAIDAKQRNATLVGEGYSAPVDYWLPFNGDVGIHDLQTRAYFGSTIYLTNGSHGCVNTPYDAVRTIYETVSVGTPVIVYE